MTPKILLFKDLRIDSAKVSHNFMVGLPSLTGITGLATNLCSTLARTFGCSPLDFSSSVLIALDGYHLHEGFKKRFKSESATLEAVPSAWASFTAHIAFEFTPKTQAAADALQESGFNEAATDILSSLALCGGRIQNVRAPVNLDSPKLVSRFETQRGRALAMLPSQSLVIQDTDLIAVMRGAGIPLMEGLAAATLPHSRRPSKYKAFFESVAETAQDWRLAPCQNGYLVIDAEGAGLSTRADYRGEQGPSFVASPTLTLVRLQAAASVRASLADKRQKVAPFWSLFSTPKQFFCACQ